MGGGEVSFPPPIPCQYPPKTLLAFRSLFFLEVNAALLKGGRARHRAWMAKPCWWWEGCGKGVEGQLGSLNSGHCSFSERCPSSAQNSPAPKSPCREQLSLHPPHQVPSCLKSSCVTSVFEVQPVRLSGCKMAGKLPRGQHCL